MSPPLRIAVHDYTGHPFQVQLSRELARRGHRVLHLYSASFLTPHGRLAREAGDPPTLEIRPLTLGERVPKGAFLRRRALEARYGALLACGVTEWGPGVVLSANTPLEAQARLWKACSRRGIRRVYWVQDLYGEAALRILREKLPGVGWMVGRYYREMERALIRKSEGAILISPDFQEVLEGALPPGEATRVIPNWAPLDELPLEPRDNPWARERGLEDRFTFLYAGTLGFKHNPGLLLELARAFREREDVRVVVLSEGEGADWLREAGRREKMEKLHVEGFQPFEAMPRVLASGDVLVALLEPEAGLFSVPSKVLTYLCASRPLLLAVPPANQAARLVEEVGAGFVTSPQNGREFVRLAQLLAGDGGTREAMGRRGREHAEAAFDIRAMGDRFEAALRG